MSSTYVDGTTPLDAVHMNALQQKVEKGQPSGYAALDSGGKVPTAQLPAAASFGLTTQVASYTLAITDANNMVEMNVAGANTLTVPPNSAVAFPVGTQVTIGQYGAGLTTIAAGAGVSLRAYNGNLKLAGQYAVCALIKRATDEWYVAGNLTP